MTTKGAEAAPAVGSDFDPEALYIALGENVYKLKRAEYANANTKIPSPEVPGIIRQLVKYGTVVASMPAVGVGIGAACTLVNLNSLKPPPNP